MKVFLLDFDPVQPIVDVLSGNKQVFQGTLPDIRPFFTNSKSNADAFLVPHDSKSWSRTYYRYVEQASEQKTILYFNRSDNPTKYKISNAISLQNTVGPYRAIHNRIVIPYNVQTLDFLDFREFKTPIISFVGYLPKISLKRMVRSLLQNPLHPLKENGALVRRIGAINLSKMQNAILQPRSYYGGAISQIPALDTHREEFVSSFEHSDFIFSPRGDANGSQRFFEALSCGRVPVVPDTNFHLPKILEERVDITYLKIKTLSTDLESNIISFWNSLNPTSYTEIQARNRRIFREYYSYSTFLLRLFRVKSIDELKKYFVANA